MIGYLRHAHGEDAHQQHTALFLIGELAQFLFQQFSFQSGLFFGFVQRGFADGFVNIDIAFGDAPGIASAADQKHFEAAVTANAKRNGRGLATELACIWTHQRDCTRRASLCGMIQVHTMKLSITLFLLAGLGWGGMVFAADEAKSGSYHVSYTERSPMSAVEFQARRFGWNMAQLKASEYEKDYELASESFEVHVPESYKVGEKWGLFVWVSPGDRGNLHENWREVLEKHKLILIGPNKVGNQRAIWCRMGLAIDAAHNMKKRYDIDANRIYVSGASGGGRVASMLGVCYPDVFKGGLYIIGCNFYREMTAPNTGGKVWRRGYAPPPATILMQAKKTVSHVLLTGETDDNRVQMKMYFGEFKKDGFLGVTYIEVPGMGHQAPGPEWFEKGLVAMQEAPAVKKPASKP
jgi:predicted esterase